MVLRTSNPGTASRRTISFADSQCPCQGVKGLEHPIAIRQWNVWFIWRYYTSFAGECITILLSFYFACQERKRKKGKSSFPLFSFLLSMKTWMFASQKPTFNTVVYKRSWSLLTWNLGKQFSWCPFVVRFVRVSLLSSSSLTKDEKEKKRLFIRLSEGAASVPANVR